MKIGVLSDTHLNQVSDDLKRVMEELFKDVELILHAGDITSIPVLTYLEAFGTLAVSGNMDLPDVARTLPQKREIDAGRHKIGLIHGYGPPEGLAHKVRPSFEQIDCLIFGHTHRPMNETVGHEIWFNPGSMTLSRFSGIKTVGLLTIDQTISGEIITL